MTYFLTLVACMKRNVIWEIKSMHNVSDIVLLLSDLNMLSL